MASIKTNIYVYAHWQGMHYPQSIGILSAQQAKAIQRIIRREIFYVYVR